MRLKRPRWAITALAIAIMAIAACGGRQRKVGGTRIPDTAINRGIIDTIEAYRQAVERRDTQALMLMASPKYREDSGTVTGGDDYGVKKLATVLQTRFQMAEDIRYSMRYVSIHKACPGSKGGDDVYPGCKALVEVLIDASFTVVDARGQPRRPDKRDQGAFELEWQCDDKGSGSCRWLFVSGM
jgi:hypothetical protein